jgi:Circadian oscillating protein COP23
MKYQFLAPLMSGIAIALAAIATASQASYASGTSFYCGQSNGVPTTYARTQDGKKVAMIRWVSSNGLPPNWTPQRRCQEVSRRFQKNYDNGSLRYIATGSLNGMPVVYAAASEGDPCTESNILFTLKPGSNANSVVKTLLDRRGLAAGNPVTVRGGRTPIFVDVDAYLNNVTSEPSNEVTPGSANKR